MYRESKYDQLVYNGRIVSKHDKLFTKIDDYPIVYEVIKVKDGVPLYYIEHMERMSKSAELIGFKCPCNEEVIRDEIRMLVEATGEKNQNIKLLYTEVDGRVESFVFFIPSYYPEPEVYKKGVSAFVYHVERENPNAKVLNLKLREEIDELKKETNSYEALLVNVEGHVTEGSKSNLFFVKDDKVITAKDEDVLKGITRQKILGMMEFYRIEHLEIDIKEEDINSFDGAFITGTSINILPLSNIGSKEFIIKDVPLIGAMMNHLNQMTSDYIKENL